MGQTSRIRNLSESIIERARREGLTVATAESCTGGLIAGALTDVPGSSAVFDRSFVTYSNEAKIGMLAVPPPLLARYGAVSAEVARSMAAGALAKSRADVAVSVTGIAGPGGGGPEKPVGLVWFAMAVRDGKPPRVERRVFSVGSRSFVRVKAVETALLMMLRGLETHLP